MLILTRKVGESILIGDDIEIVITNLNNWQVGVGIKAPKNVAVDREEIRYKKMLTGAAKWES